VIGAGLLDRITAAGAAASLDPDRRVRISGVSRLPEELLVLLRENRAAIAEALARRDAEPDGATERAAMAEHYAAPPEPDPYRPSDPDPLRDGLLAGWRESRIVRLAAAAERLEAARPRPTHGIRDLDRQACHAAAQAAAGLSSLEWVAWRATIGTAAVGWPPRFPAPPPAGGGTPSNPHHL
jgi:hypothetical protein